MRNGTGHIRIRKKLYTQRDACSFGKSLKKGSKSLKNPLNLEFCFMEKLLYFNNLICDFCENFNLQHSADQILKFLDTDGVVF